MGRRCDSERDNANKHKKIILDYFGVDISEVEVSRSGICPRYYDLDNTPLTTIDVLMKLYRNEDIIIFFDDIIKRDFSVRGNTIEVKESGDLMCETLSITKSDKNKKKWIKLCESLGLDPHKTLDIALRNFASKYGKMYIDNVIRKLSSHFLFNGEMISKDDFLKKYKFVIDLHYTPFGRFQVKIKDLSYNETPIEYVEPVSFLPKKKEKIEGNIFEKAIYNRKIEEWKKNQKKLGKTNLTPGEGTRTRIKKESIIESLK